MAAAKLVEDSGRMQAVTFAVLVISYLGCARGLGRQWGVGGGAAASAAAPALRELRRCSPPSPVCCRLQHVNSLLASPTVCCCCLRPSCLTPAAAPLHPICRSLNSSLNLLNKWSLGVYGFRFPFLLTSCESLQPSCSMPCRCAA